MTKQVWTVSHKGCKIIGTLGEAKCIAYKINGQPLGRYNTIEDAMRAIDVLRSNVMRLQSFQIVL